MGRPSKLNDAQWKEIHTRLLAGEKAAALGREFQVSKTAISKRFSGCTETIKVVANQLVAAEVALRKLPVTEQVAALNLADELRNISVHLAGAARYGAATAHRLAGIANGKVVEIDDAKPLDEESMDSLKGVAVLTEMANKAAHVGLNLLAANKEAVAKIGDSGADSYESRLRRLYEGPT